MSFSYQFGANPPIDYPRFLASDTIQTQNGQRVYAFEDSEILMATQIELGVWQSGMFFSGGLGVTPLTTPPISYRRVAANLLDALAADQARQLIIAKLLDVELNNKASDSMREQAKYLRQLDDESGAFVIIEQVNDVFSFRDRFWKTVQRAAGAVV